MAASIDTRYISVSCNRVPHCLDWGLNNTICYGSSNSVVIVDPQDSNGSGTVVETAAIHRDRVNSVRWLQNGFQDSVSELVSCSSDKTAIHWKFNNENAEKLSPVGKLVGHSDAVNVTDGICVEEDESEIWASFDRLFATASSDSSVKIWGKIRDGLDDEGIKCIQSINFKSDFVLDLKFGFNPKTNVPLLLLGGTDTKVHIYIKGKTEFEKVLSLSGHEDWIRTIDIALENEKNLLIASAAQDCLIRIWRLSLEEKEEDSKSKDELKLKDNAYTIAEREGTTKSFIVRLDAIMAGHENWIYGLHWCPQRNIGVAQLQPLKLLSASMDKTMIIWECDQNLGVWLEKVRVGEVGGNTLGFYGNRFSPDGRFIIAHGYQGAFHLWHNETENGQWKSSVTVSGHFRDVRDIDWDPEGEFLMSVSADQTTRLHAPWNKHEGTTRASWYELARPQVHGYDLTCITMLGRLMFASGADEKVLRAFEAPKNFVENFARLSSRNIEALNCDRVAPEGASVPALGLSNKAVFEKSPVQTNEPKHPKDIYPESYFISTTLNEPPTEEMLLQNTLWPEVHKLYGHGYEVFCVASNPDGTILASACKASKQEHAAVFLWNTTTWKNTTQLIGHSLTVTQLAFSPCGKRLLSVSRDRTWCLYSARETDQNWHREAYSDKTNSIHSRIIWTCTWSHDSRYFATGSRDKKAIVWKEQCSNDNTSSLGNWAAATPALNLEDSVTAVDFAPWLLANQSYLLAVGLDNGTIHIYKWKVDENQCIWTLGGTLNNIYHHHLTVTRLRFNPKRNISYEGKDAYQLATCGADCSVRIYDIYL